MDYIRGQVMLPAQQQVVACHACRWCMYGVAYLLFRIVVGSRMTLMQTAMHRGTLPA
jgi:hypothetical protein